MNIRRLLIASLALRLLLVFLGGQQFFPDEARYGWILETVHSGPLAMISHPAHPGFFALMFPIAALQTGVAYLIGAPKESLDWIPAAVNALISAWVIALIYGIALRSTGKQPVALLAAGFAATSAPLLYFCRHLVPYDAALAFALLAAYLVVHSEPLWRRSFLAGLAAGFSFLLYNGSVLLVLIVLLGATYVLRRSLRDLVALAVGALVPSICLLLFAGVDYWRALLTFSSTVTQGWFADGPWVPWQYLWSADHAILILLLVGLIAAFRTTARPYAWAAVALYCSLALASYGFNKWVIYGRTARTLLPFLCIAAAGGWHRIWIDLQHLPRRYTAWIGGAAAAAIAVQLVFNFAPIVLQRFPSDINRELSRFGGFTVAASVGPCAAGQQPAKAPLVLMNSGYLWPVDCFAVEPRGRIIYQTPHPLQYEPYSYESFAPQQRSLLKRADISIRLLQQ